MTEKTTAEPTTEAQAKPTSELAVEMIQFLEVLTKDREMQQERLRSMVDYADKLETTLKAAQAWVGRTPTSTAQHQVARLMAQIDFILLSRP